MKSSLCAFAATSLLWGACAWAQGDTEGASPLSAAVESPRAAQASQGDSAAVPKVSRPIAVFAPSSVATVTRLTPERKLELRFIKDQAAASRFQLEASKLALTRSSAPAVRALAASRVNHNNAIGLELAHLLHSRGLAAPMLANDQRKSLGQLEKLAGSRFDKSYMEVMAARQREDLREFEKASLALHDPQVKAWIDKTLPSMQLQQEVAQRPAPGARAASTATMGAPRAGLQPIPTGNMLSRPLLAPAALGARPVATGISASSRQ